MHLVHLIHHLEEPYRVQSLCVVRPRLLCWYGPETALRHASSLSVSCCRHRILDEEWWLGASSLWSLLLIFPNTVSELAQRPVNLPFFAEPSDRTFSWALCQLRERNGHKTEKLDWSWCCQVDLGTLCISGGSMFTWILPPAKKRILTLELGIHPSYTSMANAFILPSYTNSTAPILCSSPLTLLPHLPCCTLTKVTDKCLKYNQACTHLSLGKT